MTLLSRQNVDGLRPLVEEKVHKTLAGMEAASKAGEAVDIFAAWRCMTMDIISDFAFGTCLNSLDEPGFDSTMVKVLEATIPDFYRVSTASSLVNNFISGLIAGYSSCVFQVFLLSLVSQ